MSGDMSSHRWPVAFTDVSMIYVWEYIPTQVISGYHRGQYECTFDKDLQVHR